MWIFNGRNSRHARQTCPRNLRPIAVRKLDQMDSVVSPPVCERRSQEKHSIQSKSAFANKANSVAEYTITFACSARRELEALDARLIQRIVAAIEALAKEPRPRGFRKLRGASHLWKIRIGE